MQIFCLCCCFLQGQGHSNGSCDQNMTLSTIFSDFLVTKLGLMMHNCKAESSVKKIDYCIQGQGHSEGSEC